MLRDGIIYVLETKGEIYSDTRKNLLLSKLDTIDGYKGVLIYSDFMNKVGSETLFDDFLIQAALDAERRHGKELLVDEDQVAEEDRFVRYLPAYKPESAYRKFVKNQAKVKIDGWLRVTEMDNGYAENYFVVQMKSDAMSPELSHNEWAIFAAGTSPAQAVDRIVIFHHAHVDDNHFGKNVTIRKFVLQRNKAEDKLFETLKVLLEPSSKDYPTFELNDIASDAGIEIAGVMVAPA
jgi:hypothetical protein